MPRIFPGCSVPLLTLALSAAPVAARAAPPFVAESSACRVVLAQLSYDDPDADDAELLVLRVERLLPSGGPPLQPLPVPSPAAPGAPCVPEVADAGKEGGKLGDAAEPAGDLELGHCGLERLELVNGSGGGCDVYRTIPLAAVVVPADGYVVLCATDSALASAGVCDLVAAGGATLRNGWLQNGSADGLRFVSHDASFTELSYEGAPSCFGAVAPALPEERGVIQVNGETQDDVALLCGDVYRLAPLSFAGLRDESGCAPLAGDAGDAGTRSPDEPPCPAGACDSGVSLSGGQGAGGAPWVPELAPPLEPAVDPSGFGAGIVLDAGGLLTPTARGGDAPSPPGCSARPGVAPGPGSSGVLALAVAWLIGARRRARK